MQSKVPKQKLGAGLILHPYQLPFTYTLLYALLKHIKTFPYAILVHKPH